MVVERTTQGILLKTDAPINLKMVQQIIDYCTALEINGRTKGTQKEADELAQDVNKKWWTENKHRFIK